MRIIVNADDMGMTAGVTRGVEAAILRGIATSASFMASMPDSDAAALRIVELGLDVGVHLNITQGRPLTPSGNAPNLTDATGTFLTPGVLRVKLENGLIPAIEIESEFCSQIERTIELGISPTHLDTHHHVHASSEILSVLESVALRYGITKLRNVGSLGQSNDDVLQALEADAGTERHGVGAQEGLSGRRIRMPAALLKAGERLEDWIVLLERSRLVSGTDVVEVVCHPGEIDDDLRRVSGYVSSRERELRVITSAKLLDAASELGVEFVSFRDF